MTKKLEKLLQKYKLANRARINAYAKRSRVLGGVWSNKLKKRVFSVPVTDQLKKELDADIEVARLYKLEVSKEIRDYCKQRKLHIKWGDCNQITGIYNDTSYKLRSWKGREAGNTLLAVLFDLKLSSKERWIR